MKKYLLITALFVGFLLPAQAQDENKNDGGRIEALKIAYITKKLNLSPEEAQKFWPVYNKYTDEIRRVQIESRQNKGSELEREEKLLNIRKKFNGEFGKALSADKVNSFFKVEKEFNGMVQKEMMERRQLRLENRNRIKQR
ncbi:MAG: hypothetical protein IPP79_24030 [Chitinophagaceae bacterium]|nr:hypothetical protein [Chitinophagaceae bacterium]